MANEEHLAILEQGKKTWNEWRKANPRVLPDLSKAFLNGRDLDGFDFREANFHKANLNLAELRHANLSNANFNEADLSFADFLGAKFTGATLDRVNLICARLVDSNIADTRISNSYVYGISAWDIKGTPREASNLIITRPSASSVTVDNLEVAQFIHLLLHREKIRNTITTITTKGVLILGRFTQKRKPILEAIYKELRSHDYLPILFTFDPPTTRNPLETIMTLVSIARFVIADITNPRSVPMELTSVVEKFPSVPVQLLLRAGSKPWGMCDHIQQFSSVLPIVRYKNVADLIAVLPGKVIAPAERKATKVVRRGKNLQKLERA